MKYKAATVGLAMAAHTLGSAAVTLGRAQGAAWIGQPLELVVPVQMDPGQSGADLCLEAEVFHGDNRQQNSRIQIVAVTTDQADVLNLKISSGAPVDEPVVTVYLYAVCGRKFSRKYVLLADFPSTAAAPPAQEASAPEPPAAAPVPLDLDRSAAKQSADNSTPPKPGLTIPVTPKETAKPVVAVLRLAPVDAASPRVQALATSVLPLAEKVVVTSDSQKLQALQSDLKALLEQAAKNEARLQAMQERLAQTESERAPVGVLYGLGALLLLCMGAMAYLWTRRAKPFE